MSIYNINGQYRNSWKKQRLQQHTDYICVYKGKYWKSADLFNMFYTWKHISLKVIIVHGVSSKFIKRLGHTSFQQLLQTLMLKVTRRYILFWQIAYPSYLQQIILYQVGAYPKQPQLTINFLFSENWSEIKKLQI